jgi:type IV secretory pathway component VirB8
MGESIGHYESGDTLVVDTIGLNDKTYVDNFRTPHTTKLHVVERFKINPDQKGLTVDVTVEDPGAFTQPWHAVQRYRRVQNGPMPEQSCAENPTNFLSYEMDPIPHADRPDF